MPTTQDYRRCLEETGADGVMSSESLLENPALFMPEDPQMTDYDRARRQLRFSREYLDLAAEHWPCEGVASVKVILTSVYFVLQWTTCDLIGLWGCVFNPQGHLFKMLYRMTEHPQNHDLRDRMGAKGTDLEGYRCIVDELEDRYGSESSAQRRYKGQLLMPTSWYRRHWEGQAQVAARDVQIGQESLLERLRKARAARLAAGATVGKAGVRHPAEVDEAVA
jgi:tRNA-dihydrouridine synthase